MYRMSTEQEEQAPAASIFEKLLAYTALTTIAAAVLSFLATLIVGLAAGRDALTDSLWPVVVWISYVGLPIGFALLMILLIVNFSKRSRADRARRKA